MPKTVLLVFSDATAGDDAEFNRWYEEQHIPDVLKIETASAAQRFALAPSAADKETFPWRYLAIYEIESEDVAAFQAALGARAGTAAMPISPTLDTKTVKTLYATAVGPRQTARR